MSFRQRFSSKWVSALLVLALVWMVSEAAGMWVRVRRLGDEAERMEDRVAEMERDITRRQVLLEQIQEPAWLSYQARLRLNYKMPDEHVVVVYKKEKSDIISPSASVSVQSENSFWTRWLGSIRGVIFGTSDEEL